ncbi:Poly(A)-binding protein binding protein [Naegleria gruberi]|uniref:Poly(A)-binding protein binding protein n=1 Tax=Naegleria gruberi TaxID=5762 RepID=D2V0R5_NAEGR|nr:Poly(A)-binding protein binding protein [Naegleria gruberi]EFC49773.1 Poly(A)-binding protein binding protein [Naegleria gruberi]|eukprot:XP_002682517.1 Poly(A)-binding protein binding protein [Naegleria gruberi strain NEG-M]
MVSKQNNGGAAVGSSGVVGNASPASSSQSTTTLKKNQSSGQQQTPNNNNNNSAWSNKTKPSPSSNNTMDNNQKRNNANNNNKGSVPNNNQQPNQHQNKNGSNVNTNPPRVKNTHNTTHSENNEQYKHKSEINRKRMFFLFLNFVGHVVEIVNVSGEVYEGIFHTAKADSLNDDFVFVLTLAKLIGGSGTQTIHETMTFKSKDVQQIYAKNITFNAKKAFTSFKTDTEISNRQQTEKELIKWQPEENEAELISLEEGTYAPRQWDQFSENLNKFGVKSTYEEHLYTTNLDRNSDFYKTHAAKASRIAEEIEKSAPSLNSIHILEERGLLEQTDISEEDLYSSVIRDPKGASAFKKQPKKNIPKTTQPLATNATQPSTPGKYVPPHKQPKGHPTSQPIVKQTQEAEAVLDKEPIKIKPLSPIIEGIKGSIGKSRSVSQVVLPEKSLIEKSQSIPIETPKPKNVTNLLVDTTRPGRSNSFTIGSAPLPQKIEEHKNIRAQLTKPVTVSPKLGSGTMSPTLPSSPLGFPKATSPSTPNPIKESIMSLHLHPFVPKVTPEVVEHFMEYKKKSSDLNRNREKETSSFKEFSSLLSSKIKDAPESTTTSAATKPTTETKPATETKKEQPKEEEKPKPKSTLNPNAKAFVFNPKTPAFVPKITTPTPPTSTTTPPTNPQMPQVTQPPQMVPPGVGVGFYPTPPIVGYPPAVGTPFVYTPQFPPTNPSYNNNFRTVSWAGKIEDIQIRNHFFKVSLDQFEKSVGPTWLDDEEIEQRKSFKDADATSITSVDIDSQTAIHPQTNPQPFPYHYYPQPGMMVPPPFATPVVTAYSGYFPPPVNPIPREQ